MLSGTITAASTFWMALRSPKPKPELESASRKRKTRRATQTALQKTVTTCMFIKANKEGKDQPLGSTRRDVCLTWRWWRRPRALRPHFRPFTPRSLSDKLDYVTLCYYKSASDRPGEGQAEREDAGPSLVSCYEHFGSSFSRPLRSRACEVNSSYNSYSIATMSSEHILGIHRTHDHSHRERYTTEWLTKVKIIHHIRILLALPCFVLLKEGQFSNPSPPRPSSLIDEKPIPTNIKSSLPTYNFAKLNTATFVKPGTLGPSPGQAEPVSMRRRTREEWSSEANIIRMNPFA